MPRWGSRTSSVARITTSTTCDYRVVVLFAGSAAGRAAALRKAVEVADGGGILVVHDSCPPTLLTMIGLAGLGYCGMWLDPDRSDDDAFREAAVTLAPSATSWWWHSVRGRGRQVCTALARRHDAAVILP